MTVAGAQQRSYSDLDKGGALLALDLNKGYVLPTANALGIPRSNLEHWDAAADATENRALAANSEQKNVQNLANTFLKLAQAGADHALATLDKASPYHGALIAAISLDKWALITGRPTSRTEVLRARYVEPEGLRKVSGAVIDVSPVAIAGPSAPRRRSPRTAAKRITTASMQPEAPVGRP